MAGDITEYLNLITSEHRDKPKFVAMLSVLLQGLTDAKAVIQSLPSKFDIDTAVGVQLDAVGQWIGRTRVLNVPISDVYFAWGTPGLGWSQGIWYQTGDPTNSVMSLPDEQYRLLLKATAAANGWDGTVPDAYRIWNVLFEGTGYGVIIVDNQNMSMTLGLYGKVPDVLTQALFTGGYLDLRPEGVRIAKYVLPTADAPLFGFGIQNQAVSGFGTGCWARFTDGN